ncbi:MAG: hypothetical protein ABFD82_21135 [Syntrophaceae bacterium]
MAIVCYICKKEVPLVSFGDGFVGTCCGGIWYNSAIKPKFDMREEEKKYFLNNRHAKEEGIAKQNIPDRERRDYNEPSKRK